MYSKGINFFATVCVILGFSFLSVAQTTLVLQPDSVTGKDATLRDLGPNTNYGHHEHLVAHAWTHGGIPVTLRGIIDFDLSSIPSGALITSASLSLYGYNSPVHGPHSTQNGSNAATLSRVLTPWDENTVTWNTQPTTTTQNQVFLPASTSPLQDYININVTGLVQDMVDDPVNSHGFLFKLVTEQLYRRMIFGSSENPDPALRPKLVVTYIDQPQVDTCIIITSQDRSIRDATLRDLGPNTNYDHHDHLTAHTWTHGGIPVTLRALIDFELSSIPAGAIVTSANLSLYTFNSPVHGTHSTQNGSNASTLSRVTSPWNETTVTWNTEPSTTTQNQVLLPPSVFPNQHYLNINVTNVVQDMVDDPANSHGFLFKLVTEVLYRRMIFASTENADSTLHPTLEICYSMPVSTPEIINFEDKWNLYPNPASDYVRLDFSDIEEVPSEIKIVSYDGKLIERVTNLDRETTIDISDYPKGIYLILAQFDQRISSKKMVVK